MGGAHVYHYGSYEISGSTTPLASHVFDSAGVFDVALRALAPRVRLAPGFVRYAVKARRGPARNAFAMYTSLMPGTLPAADEEGALVYHCLDGNPEVAAQLADDERRLAEIVGDRSRA